MNQTDNKIKMSKSEITDMIISEEYFKKILRTYKKPKIEGLPKTTGFITTRADESKTGLSNVVCGITLGTTLIALIVPIFSSKPTITWDHEYLEKIKNDLPEEYTGMKDQELINLIRIPMYFYDEVVGDVIFMQLIKLTDYINRGIKGSNGHSVYFFNDALPKSLQMGTKELTGEIFVASLPKLSNKELKDICTAYANNFHKRFADITLRTEQTKVKNIAQGLYAQIKTYLWMLRSGYDVRMEWMDGDDLGIDIIFTVDGKEINIDVKSTKTDSLKISKSRKETHFYAVCNWNKSEPQLLGLLFKHNFWKSDFINTLAPEKKNDMYTKTLKQIAPDLVTMDKTFTILHNYERLKKKHGQRLFNAE